MLGLGIDISKQSIGSGASSAPALTQWTETTFGPLTSPELGLAGSNINTTMSVYVDKTNDWTGTLSDYSIINLVIYNVTDDVTHNFGDTTFASSADFLVLYILQKSGFNCNALVGAVPGKTIRFTFTLRLGGYEDVELTATISF